MAATGAATGDGQDWWTGIDPSAMRALAATFVPNWAALLLSCAVDAYTCWNGGNQWSGESAFLSFFRHVAQLPLDYSKWEHYEAAAIHSGPRMMHREFCIVSDRPILLMVDAENRPHCEDGPFCAWRDGTALWAWHGTRVPAWIIAHPELLTAQRIQQEQNTELRRVMLERFGFSRYVDGIGALPIHADETGTLYRCDIEGDEPLVIVRVQNSTPEPDGQFKHYTLRVPSNMTQARQAVAWTFGKIASEYRPALET
jgi:hypothetical protein